MKLNLASVALALTLPTILTHQEHRMLILLHRKRKDLTIGLYPQELEFLWFSLRT